MGGVDIAMSIQIKLLGVTIDNKLTFNAHVAEACRRAIGVYHQLARAAKVSWGLHPEVTITTYTATVEPIILYAASVWAPTVNKLGVQKQLNAVQRGFAQKLCRAHKTTSLNSALVLTGILPLDLRVREAASLHEARKGIPQLSLTDREVEQPIPATEAPHPATHIGLEYRCLMDQEQLDENSDYDVRI